jgi:hypothetical protein
VRVELCDLGLQPLGEPHLSQGHRIVTERY